MALHQRWVFWGWFVLGEICKWIRTNVHLESAVQGTPYCFLTVIHRLINFCLAWKPWSTGNCPPRWPERCQRKRLGGGDCIHSASCSWLGILRKQGIQAKYSFSNAAPILSICGANMQWTSVWTCMTGRTGHHLSCTYDEDDRRPRDMDHPPHWCILGRSWVCSCSAWVGFRCSRSPVIFPMWAMADY